MSCRTLLRAALLMAFALMSGRPVAAADTPFRIGLIVPLTGPFTTTGHEIVAAVKAYMQEHGSVVAARQVQLIIRDDGGIPDASRRLAQELVVNQHVDVLGGMGLTPIALAVAPIATQARVPEVVMVAASAKIPEASPYIVRTAYAVPQNSTVIAAWAAAHDIHKVVTFVSDYGPGIDSENSFRTRFQALGGQVVLALRVPMANADFAPFLQRAVDAHPDAIFLFLPSGTGVAFWKQAAERGLDKTGIRMIGAGEVLDDEVMDEIGPGALGAVTAFVYSAAHPSAENVKFLADVAQQNGGKRGNIIAVGAYDGAALIYQALARASAAGSSNVDGPALLAAMKGLAWVSPRGPVRIDPATREMVQNVYLRRTLQRDGHFWNFEFQTVPAVGAEGIGPGGLADQTAATPAPSR